MRRLATVLLAVSTGYVGVAVACARWPYPAPFDPPGASGATVPALRESDAGPRLFRVRDGVSLHARMYASSGAGSGVSAASVVAPPSTSPAGDVVILFVHGVTASSDVVAGPVAKLRAATRADVVAIDLRGHGSSGGDSWHVAYFGQYEDDLADVVAELRAERLDRPVILAGHSMGGGIALRYAQKRGAPAVDGYLLIAPLLGGGAPTMRPPESAGETPAHVRFHTPRFVGLLMLNVVGWTAWNDLPVLYFDVPPDMPAYTFAALGSMQPNPPSDYRAALAAIDAPLLVIAGAGDRTFRAAEYPAVVRAHSGGRAIVVEGESHTSILESDEALAAIAAWLPRSLRD
jgi:pimeloyl-ACP methyl ester carboxylesterase